MALTPITRRLVPDDIFDQLLDDVVDGELAPGDSLPSERNLAELLGVSRPAVREALQRLSATHLLEVRHGGATTVRDFQRYAGLDLLPRLLVRNGTLDTSVARSIVEARLAVGPTVARLAAERVGRHPQAWSDRLLGTIADLESAPEPIARQQAALAFWDALVDLADSIAFRLMFNSLRLAYEPALEALTPLLNAEVSNVSGYHEVADAVLGGSAPRAGTAAEALLRPATRAITDFLDQYEAAVESSESQR